MKQAVNSLFNAILRSRTGVTPSENQQDAQAPGRPMVELSSTELKFVAGGTTTGPHGSWNAPCSLPASDK